MKEVQIGKVECLAFGGSLNRSWKIRCVASDGSLGRSW